MTRALAYAVVARATASPFLAEAMLVVIAGVPGPPDDTLSDEPEPRPPAVGGEHPVGNGAVGEGERARRPVWANASGSSTGAERASPHRCQRMGRRLGEVERGGPPVDRSPWTTPACS